MLGLLISIVLAVFVYSAFRYKGTGVAILYALGAFIIGTIIIPIVFDQLNAGISTAVDAVSTSTGGVVA